MNLAHRSRYLTMISCLAFVPLAGCAEYKAENPALTEYPGIQSQIENFYDANATEDDWVCDSPQMHDDRQVPGGRPVGDARSGWRSPTISGPRRCQAGQGGDQCQGFNTRFFTFDKGSGGQLSLVKMSGPQRGGGA